MITALIVLVALWGVAVLLAGVWSLWADWSFERRERAEVVSLDEARARRTLHPLPRLEARGTVREAPTREAQ